MEFLERREELRVVLKSAQDDVYNYSALLEKYSSFPKDKMLSVLIEILNILEEVEFCYVSNGHFICQSIFYNDKKDRFKFEVCMLESVGKLIELDKEYFSYESIRFYNLCANGDFKVKPSFPGYEYLTEFINTVVSYRFKNEVEKISDDELERLKNQFLLEKLGEKRDALINLMDGVSKKLDSSESSSN